MLDSYGGKRFRRLVVWAAGALLFTGCLGYQVEPLLEVSTRDEEFSRGSPLDYTGETITLGFRYVPPVVWSDVQLARMEAAMYGSRGRDLPPAPIIIDHKDDEPADHSGELDSLAEWGVTQWAGAVMALLAASLLAWVIVLWRRAGNTSGKDPGDGTVQDA